MTTYTSLNDRPETLFWFSLMPFLTAHGSPSRPANREVNPHGLLRPDRPELLWLELVPRLTCRG